MNFMNFGFCFFFPPIIKQLVLFDGNAAGIIFKNFYKPNRYESVCVCVSVQHWFFLCMSSKPEKPCNKYSKEYYYCFLGLGKVYNDHVLHFQLHKQTENMLLWLKIFLNNFYREFSYRIFRRHS